MFMAGMKVHEVDKIQVNVTLIVLNVAIIHGCTATGAASSFTMMSGPNHWGTDGYRILEVGSRPLGRWGFKIRLWPVYRVRRASTRFLGSRCRIFMGWLVARQGFA